MDWTERLAREYRAKIEMAASSQSDEDALDSVELFPAWREGIAVAVGERYQYDNVLYKVVQAHTTQADWAPDISPALFTEVSVVEWPEIPENIPSTAPWMKGDKGTWKGQHYICQLNNTVWNPDQYAAAWKLAD